MAPNKTVRGFFQSLIDESAIKSWSWYYFFLFYAIVPLSILVIPLLGLNDLFILNVCNPSLVSIYLNHFFHQTLPHFSGNLIFYLISLSGILFLEKNKIRFQIMMVYNFVILPVISSMLFIVYFHRICIVRDTFQNYGFSAIALCLVGYCVYLILLSGVWPLFYKIIESYYHSDSLCSRITFFESIFFLNFVFVIFILIFGFAAGIFSLAGNSSLNNGLLHSFGFVSGIFIPMLLELKKDDKINLFHKTMLIHFEALIITLTFYLMYIYITWQN